MEKKYRALRIISGIYFFMGTVVLVFGTLGAFSVASSPSYAYLVNGSASRASGFNIIAGIVLEVGVLVVGVGLLAISQLVDLLMDLEENTRASAESQSDQVKLLKMLVRQSQGARWMSEKKDVAELSES